MVVAFTVLIVVIQSVYNMEIKTKYNLDDEVYTLHKNKVAKVKIRGVECVVCNSWSIIKYTTDIVEGLFETGKVFKEEELFKTKEELLKSL